MSDQGSIRFIRVTLRAFERLAADRSGQCSRDRTAREISDPVAAIADGGWSAIASEAPQSVDKAMRQAALDDWCRGIALF